MGQKYPLAVKSWRTNWVELSTYLKYPEELRRIIYTTNTVENYHMALRKVTKAKAVFPNDQSTYEDTLSGHHGHYKAVEGQDEGLAACHMPA